MKQLSVFIENRHGRLGDVLDVIKESNVNILSLSLADTTEYGLLRLIVDKPENAKDALSKAGFSAMLTEVLIVKLAHEPGFLHNILKSVTNAGISIEYMYGLSAAGNDASVVFKTADVEKATKVLIEGGAQLLTEKELSAF